MRQFTSRLRAIGYWIAAPILMLALYWPGLLAWFQKDDFAWLGLRGLVHSPRDLAWALFAPLAQGTIRTLSERVVNLSFVSLFGFHAFPFRCLAFVTCIAAISMLSAVATKLSGSRAVGFWAAIVWTLNSAIATPLAWTAVYYELAWPFWLLTMFWLLLRYDETGERRFLIAQCVMFVLGFFVLEMNVVYPAIAAAYALLTGKRALLVKVLPLFAISILYTAIHFYFAPLQSSGPYQMHWDLRIFQTLVQYWGWALGPGQGRLLGIVSTAIRSTLVWSLTGGLVALLIFRKRLTLLLPVWFLIALAPLLPLRDHMTDEYLTAPTLGLAIWVGWAMVSGWRATQLVRAAAVLLFIVYAGFMIRLDQLYVRNISEPTQRIRTFVLSVVESARAHPGKSVLLEGVNSELFNGAVYDGAFHVFGVDDLLLVPENRTALAIPPHFAGLDRFFADPAVVNQALENKLALVIDVTGGVARDATVEYRESLKAPAR
jgi:hypothetical protein